MSSWKQSRIGVVFCALSLLGCETSGPPLPSRRPVPRGAEVFELPPDEAQTELPPAVGDARAREHVLSHREQVIERALASDAREDDSALIPVRRYVYRVRLSVPETLGENRSDLAAGGAEIFIDVSEERLRARFVGPGWPVEAGSEVRVRADSAGAYVFDREGGRSLSPGALSEWFEGGVRDRNAPPLSVRRDPSRIAGGSPGPLICALLAEWGGEPRENVMRRCEPGAPLGFRVGLWRAERTADVPVELPRRALRADEADPPALPPYLTSRAFLEPSALARIPQMERAPRDLPPSPDELDGLEFVNESEARVVVTVEGIAVGWVDAHARGLFRGFVPGVYRIAALRPMGAVVIRPRITQIPGRTVLGAPRRRESE